MMRKEDNAMKMIRVNSILIVGLLLMGVIESQAVDYKSTYRGIQNTEYRVQTTSALNSMAPNMGFRSTSAYSGQWNQDAQKSMLNSDGSVNAGAYGVGQTGAPSRSGNRRKADSNGDGFDDETGLPVDNIDNPIIDPNDPGNVPLGDVMWPLMLLACAYCAFLIKRTRKREAR